MNKFFKHIFFLAAAFISCFFISCENDIKEVQDLGKKKIGVEEGYNIVSYLSLGAVMKAKLTAPLMLRTESDTPKVEFPKTLHVDFYNDSTKIESQLFAKYGRYLENENKVFLKDSVVVFNIHGDTLRTQELWWDQNKEIFYTDKEVFIHQHGTDQYIHGIGLTAKQDFSSYTITNILQGSFINVPDSAMPQ
ncbi:MAG: LPS export ABC transporter periplasmic protein LptC [Chitinophagaceae bacterium]